LIARSMSAAADAEIYAAPAGESVRGKPAVHLADSAVEALVGQVKALIDNRGLSVGDPLPSERELGDMFSASRTTVREAMRILKTYGVVEVRPKAGAVIIDRRMDAVFDLYAFKTLDISQDTFLDTQQLRRLIEVGLVDALFDNVAEPDVAALRSINEAMQAERSIELAARHDFEFHLKLVDIAGNRQITEMYGIMKPVMLRIMENGVNRRKFDGTNYAEHGAIVDALESRDRLAFQYHTTFHLESGLALFVEDGDT
jgi:GntR family transcriptional repressor for pyruvate dehydrogenase complex